MYQKKIGKKIHFLWLKNKMKPKMEWMKVTKIKQRSIGIQKIVTRKRFFFPVSGEQKKSGSQK